MQELGPALRDGLAVVVFVINNGGYLIERLLGTDASVQAPYNDVPPWAYSRLPEVYGGKQGAHGRTDPTDCAPADSAPAASVAAPRRTDAAASRARPSARPACRSGRYWRPSLLFPRGNDRIVLRRDGPLGGGAAGGGGGG